MKATARDVGNHIITCTSHVQIHRRKACRRYARCSGKVLATFEIWIRGTKEKAVNVGDNHNQVADNHKSYELDDF